MVVFGKVRRCFRTNNARGKEAVVNVLARGQKLIIHCVPVAQLQKQIYQNPCIKFLKFVISCLCKARKTIRKNSSPPLS